MHKHPPSEARAKDAQCIKGEKAPTAGRQMEHLKTPLFLSLITWKLKAFSQVTQTVFMCFKGSIFKERREDGTPDAPCSWASSCLSCLLITHIWMLPRPWMHVTIWILGCSSYKWSFNMFNIAPTLMWTTKPSTCGYEELTQIISRKARTPSTSLKLSLSKFFWPTVQAAVLSKVPQHVYFQLQTFSSNVSFLLRLLPCTRHSASIQER